MTRTVAITVPHFQAVAQAATTSTLIGSLPVHFARQAAESLPLDLYLLPYDPPKLGVCLYWHKRLDRDPANIWLRGHIERALDLDRRLPPPRVKRTDNGDWSIWPATSR